jgi:hypothetical protein
MTLRYSASVRNTSEINSTYIEIKVIKGEKEEEGGEEKRIDKWNCTRVSDREQEIKIEFAKPGEISNEKVRKLR